MIIARNLLVVFSLVLTTSCWAQKYDSIYSHLNELYKAREYKTIANTEIPVIEWLKTESYVVDSLCRIAYIKSNSLRLAKKPEEAFNFLKNIISFYENHNIPQKNFKLSRAFIELSLILGEEKKRHLSIDYLNVAVEYLELSKGNVEYKSYVKTKIWCIQELGRRHYFARNYTQAEKYLKEAEALAKEYHSPQAPILKQIKLYLGRTYEKQEHYEKSLAQLQEVAEMALKSNPPSLREHSLVLESLGTVYYYQEAYEKAIKQFEAQEAIETLIGMTHDEQYNTSLNMGACYIELGAFKDARHRLDIAQERVGLALGHPHPFAEIRNNYSALNILYYQAMNALYAYKESQAPEELQNAIYYADYSVELVEAMKNSMDRKIARQNLLHTYYHVIVRAVEVYYAAFEASGDPLYKVQALHIVEKMRALQLKTARQQARAWQDSPVPDSLLEQRKTYWAQLVAAENKKDTVSQAARTTLKIREDFDLLQEQLAEDYPVYFALENTAPIRPLSEVQEALETTESVIYFITDDEKWFAFVITSDDLYFHAYGKNETIATNAEAWRKCLQMGYQPIPDSIRQQTLSLGFELYSALWKPLAPKLREKVYIIPDGILWTLPFEALLTVQPDPNELWSAQPYLLRNHHISYLTDLQQLGEERPTTANRILAVAPDFSDQLAEVSSPFISRRRIWSPLLRNTEEVERIVEGVHSKCLIGSTASKEGFLAAAPDYGILHLATHATAGNQEAPEAYLLLGNTGEEPDKLLLSDLYTHQLNADMIVLSACETALGPMQRSEGLLGLAHACQYAGAQAVVTSLWQVNDASSTELMSLFYGKLKSGQDKDQALQTAKLAYFQDKENQRAHPYYWAAFVAYGNADSVAFAKKRSWGKWLLIGLSISAGLLVVQWVRGKKRQPTYPV